jgi:hypothetical protein
VAELTPGPSINMSVFDESVDNVVRTWVRASMRQLLLYARMYCKKRGIYFSVYDTVHGATLRVRQAGGGTTGATKLENWAFENTFVVPVGGFSRAGRLPNGRPLPFLIIKPSGEIRFRTRTYNRLSGETVTRKGFLTVALEKTFTPQHLEELGVPLSQAIGLNVAKQMQRNLRSQGYTVTIT